MEEGQKAKPRRVCVQCGETTTSVWRVGPEGDRTLCNKCGLRYRKECIDRANGVVTVPRKRREEENLEIASPHFHKPEPTIKTRDRAAKMQRAASTPAVSSNRPAVANNSTTLTFDEKIRASFKPPQEEEEDLAQILDFNGVVEDERFYDSDADGTLRALMRREEKVDKFPPAGRSCAACRLAHLSCDRKRPCGRCVKNGREEDCVELPLKSSKRSKSLKSVSRDVDEKDEKPTADEAKEEEGDAESSSAPKKRKSEEAETAVKKEDEKKDDEKKEAEPQKKPPEPQPEKDVEKEAESKPPEEDPEAKERAAKRAAKQAAADALLARDMSLPEGYRYEVPPPPHFALEASPKEILVPLQINLLLDTYRLKETLVWNLADPRLTVERYAEELCHDLDLPVERFGKTISSALRKELTAQQELVQMLTDHYQKTPSGYVEDLRTIRIDLSIGAVALRDQFEWDINNTHNDPEQFARGLCTDMGLPREFEVAIAGSIRKQIADYQLQRLQGSGPPIAPPPRFALRQRSQLRQFSPQVEPLADAPATRMVKAGQQPPSAQTILAHAQRAAELTRLNPLRPVAPRAPLQPQAQTQYQFVNGLSPQPSRRTVATPATPATPAGGATTDTGPETPQSQASAPTTPAPPATSNGTHSDLLTSASTPAPQTMTT